MQSSLSEKGIFVPIVKHSKKLLLLNVGDSRGSSCAFSAYKMISYIGDEDSIVILHCPFDGTQPTIRQIDGPESKNNPITLEELKWMMHNRDESLQDCMSITDVRLHDQTNAVACQITKHLYKTAVGVLRSVEDYIDLGRMTVEKTKSIDRRLMFPTMLFVQGAIIQNTRNGQP